jgi:hypothetical protein
MSVCRVMGTETEYGISMPDQPVGVSVLVRSTGRPRQLER